MKNGYRFSSSASKDDIKKIINDMKQIIVKRRLINFEVWVV